MSLKRVILSWLLILAATWCLCGAMICGRDFSLVTAVWAQPMPQESSEGTLRRENERLRATVERLRVDLTKRDRELEQHRQQSQSLSRQLNSVLRERNIAERERHQARLRAYSLAGELERQGDKLKAEEQNLARRKAATDDEVKKHQARIRDLEQQLIAERKRPPEPAEPRANPSPVTFKPKALLSPKPSIQTVESDPAPSAKAIERSEPRRVGDLERELDLEREQRATLEQEVQRLAAESNAQQQLEEVNRSLQGARAQVLVLSNHLADERRERESLEVALAQIRKAAGVQGNSNDPASWKRLVEVMESRRAEADRLSAELREANEAIVRLKGEIEAHGSSEEASRMLAALETENQRLHAAVAAAEAANQSLRGKAELAERLAEMLYSGSGR